MILFLCLAITVVAFPAFEIENAKFSGDEADLSLKIAETNEMLTLTLESTSVLFARENEFYSRLQFTDKRENLNHFKMRGSGQFSVTLCEPNNECAMTTGSMQPGALVDVARVLGWIPDLFVLVCLILCVGTMVCGLIYELVDYCCPKRDSH